jgi:glutamate dehydrogenase/leucine dehydrogenase
VRVEWHADQIRTTHARRADRLGVPECCGEESPVVKLQRLSATDGFIVFDLDAATTCVGIARLAPKVLEDSATLLARSVTYSFASFGVAGHAGGSAGINAKPEDRDGAVKAFVEETRPLAESGRLRLAPGLGLTADDLAPLGWTEPDAALTVAGALTAAEVTGSLDGRTAAVVGSAPVAAAATKQLTAAGTAMAPARFDAECDVLFVAGKPGVLDHPTAEGVKATTIVPLTPVPVTARALAVLGRQGRVVVPDFLSIAAPLLAAHDPDGGDPVRRIRDATVALADQGTSLWLAAAQRAEAQLATWTTEKPFGRPLA